MGPGNVSNGEIFETAFELGRLIALEGWVLLTGGRNSGVMDAANKGAKQAGGLTVGILPRTNTDEVSDAVDIRIFTDIGEARNNINVLSSRVVIACGIGAGTASEIVLALKAEKKVILLHCSEEGVSFFKSLGKDNVVVASSAVEAIEIVRSTV